MATTAVAQKIRDGRYALYNANTEKWHFFRVDMPATGKWKGYTFLKEQHGDNYSQIRDRALREQILAAIEREGVHKCLALYGQHLGICCLCGRSLTDEISRAKGIGPECIKKVR